MSFSQRRAGVFFILMMAIVLLFFAQGAPWGHYNLDEALYTLGAQAFYESGQFAISNGHEAYQSDDLRNWLLIEGPTGLVPQYPVGIMVAAAPLFDWLGVKSLMLVNLLAGIATLFAAHLVARKLFGSELIANLTVVLLALCTFWVEFAVAIWPHSVSIFFCTLAVLMFLNALDRERAVWGPAALSGAIIGISAFFRLESVLLLPGIAACTLLYAARPLQVLIGGALGFVPVFALLGYSNVLRFGTLNPLSYGRSDGSGTDLAGYLVLGAVILVILLGLIAVRNFGKSKLQWQHALVLFVASIAAILVASQFVPMVKSLVNGVHAIILDSKVIEDPRPGATFRFPDGTLGFWGQPKKALVQSLPWLGCVVALLALPWGERRRSIAIILILFLAWSSPFLLRSWHGGPGANMRYLLPMLPLLSALMAWLICELSTRTGRANGPSIFLAALFGFGLTMSFALSRPELVFVLNQIYSSILSYIVASLTLLIFLVKTRGTAFVAVHVLAISLGFSSYLAFQDYSLAQGRRALNASWSEAAASVSGKVVFYGPPAGFYPAFGKPDQLVALPHVNYIEADMAFLEAACRDGYRILMTEFLSRPLSEKDGLIQNFQWDDGLSGPPMTEVNCQMLG